MKLPKFLTISPDFKRAVDAYPEKGRIVVHGSSIWPRVEFGDDHEYLNPTFAECWYARKVSRRPKAERAEEEERQRAEHIAERNKRELAAIIEGAGS